MATQRLAGNDIGAPVPELPGGEGRGNRERLATTRALLASPVSGGQLPVSGKAGLYGGFMPGDDHVRADGTAARDLDIVDAHVHLINLEALDYAWIRHRSAVLEALLDNYYDAAHDYGVGRYRSDTAGERPARWVACEFGAADPVAEAEWIQRCSQSEGAPHAFIAAVDLTSPSLGEVLARYRDLPVVHAVRQPLYWAEDRLRRLGELSTMGALYYKSASANQGKLIFLTIGVLVIAIVVVPVIRFILDLLFPSTRIKDLGGSED